MKYSTGAWGVALLALVLASVAGCSDPAGGNTDTSGGIDAAVLRDAVIACDRDSCVHDTSAHDTGVDAASTVADTGTDAASTTPDVGVDAATIADAGHDAATIADAGHDAATIVDAGHDAAVTRADANMADGGCLALYGAMGHDCGPSSGYACPAGFTCHSTPGIIVSYQCEILCNAAGFTCPCGTACMTHDQKSVMWMQCDQL